jgi:hypothetical protein
MLRLIEKADSVIAFDAAAASADARDLLRAEAAEIEAWYGKNAYSDYLSEHGRRPDPDQAAVIGRLVGMRVKASDGSMQPRRTKAERETLREARDRQRTRSRYRRQVTRLRQALASLAENEDSPSDVIDHVHPEFDEPVIRAHLDHAVEWLSRFVQEWRSRGNVPSQKGSQHT